MTRTPCWFFFLGLALAACSSDAAKSDIDASTPEAGSDGDAIDAGKSGPDGGEDGDAGRTSGDGWDGQVPTPGDVRINEVDCTGDAVELVNAGTSAQSLTGYALTDDLTAPAHAQALAGAIDRGEYKVVMLTSFGLKCGKENTFLTKNDVLVDVAPQSQMPGGATWGRLPDTTGDFAVTAATLGAKNSAFVDPSLALFKPLETPIAITLVLDDASATALRADPRTYVQGTLTVNAGGTSVGPLAVGLRLKGSVGSFRSLDGKAAFKIDADRFTPGQRIFGQSKITLNNLVQDASTIHEWLGYQMFAALGVAAPRTGYASLTVNGADYGTYLVLEDTTTNDFLASHFDSTQGLYEPAEGTDLSPEQVPNFDVKDGSKTDFGALLAIADPLANGPRDTWFSTIGDKIDWPQLLRVLIVDMVNGNSDGYPLVLNNYMLHVNSAGTLRMLPWGIDASFTAAVPLFSSRSLLLARCFEDTRCTELFVKALEDVHQKGTAFLASDVPAKARMLGALNAQRFASDTRWGGDATQIPALVDSSLMRLQDNLDNAADRIACQRDASGDFDGDKHRCDLDCDDNDATRYRGATEVCGDRIDQSCNGVADDGLECPACIADPADSALVICPRAASMSSLRKACSALAATPITIDDDAENSRVAREASGWFSGETPFFIGLSDEVTADTFVWTNGASSSYRNFVGGFPFKRNFGQGPRCATMHANDGTWNTDQCDALTPGVCER